MTTLRMDNPIIVTSSINNARRVTYRYFWNIHTMYFLNVSGALNNTYAIIDYYILQHFDLIHNKLELTNHQLLNEINNYISNHSSNPYQALLGIHSVSRAISKMEGITMLANGKSFISKVRKGISGKHSYLQLNPAVLPNTNKLNDYVWMSYKSTSSRSAKYQFIKNKFDQLRASETRVLKDLSRIRKKENELQIILDNYK